MKHHIIQIVGWSKQSFVGKPHPTDPPVGHCPCCPCGWDLEFEWHSDFAGGALGSCQEVETASLEELEAVIKAKNLPWEKFHAERGEVVSYD